METHLYRIGPGAISSLFEVDRIRASRAVKEAGLSSRGSTSPKLADALVQEVGIAAAFEVACSFFVATARRDRSARAVFDTAVKNGAGPRRDEQPDMLKLLFAWTGQPTVLGENVLQWARSQRAVPQRKAPPQKLQANLDNVLSYINLDGVSTTGIRNLLARAPEYQGTEYRRLVDDVIGAIHQIPRLYRHDTNRRIELKQIEAYFGRSSGHERNVYQRWVAGRNVRGHSYGMVFARCTVRATLAYERHGIMLLDALREHNGLCISNQSMKAVGKVGKDDPGFLYMTFRVLNSAPELAQELSRAEINAIVRNRSTVPWKHAADRRKAPEILEDLKFGLHRANDTRSMGNYKLAHFGD